MSERELLIPQHNHEQDLTLKSSLKHTLTSSKINWLLIFVPIALAFSGASDSVVFSLNFIAIIPLAKLLGFGKHKNKNKVKY
jgi:Ca2+:H+ antiporter